jgi:hypothetical protein
MPEASVSFAGNLTDDPTVQLLTVGELLAGRFPMPTPRAVWPRLPTGVVPSLRISPRPAYR